VRLNTFKADTNGKVPDYVAELRYRKVSQVLWSHVYVPFNLSKHIKSLGHGLLSPEAQQRLHVKEVMDGIHRNQADMAAVLSVWSPWLIQQENTISCKLGRTTSLTPNLGKNAKSIACPQPSSATDWAIASRFEEVIHR
jgi:hypothetical protein